MKTVIATSKGSISYDATANSREIKFKEGDDVTLPDFQADFLVQKCKKAKYKTTKKEAPKKVSSKKQSSSTEDK